MVSRTILIDRETDVFHSTSILKVMLSCFGIINYIATHSNCVKTDDDDDDDETNDRMHRTHTYI